MNRTISATIGILVFLTIIASISIPSIQATGMTEYFKQKLIEARDSGNTEAMYRLKISNGSDSDFIQAVDELGGWSAIFQQGIENKGSIGADNTFSETIDKLAEAMK